MGGRRRGTLYEPIIAATRDLRASLKIGTAKPNRHTAEMIMDDLFRINTLTMAYTDHMKGETHVDKCVFCEAFDGDGDGRGDSTDRAATTTNDEVPEGTGQLPGVLE